MRAFHDNLAQPIVAVRLQLQRELAYLILCALRQLSCPAKKARNYLAMQAFLLTTAVAHWVKPSTQNLMWFFYRSYPPTQAIAIFMQREEDLTSIKPIIHERSSPYRTIRSPTPDDFRVKEG